MSEDLPWPEPAASLFVDRCDDRLAIACLNFSRDAWIGYVEGYRRAGRALVERVLDTGNEQDYLVYPIVFLYRQYLELRMKDIIRRGGELLEFGEGFETTHDLERLWRSCRSVLERVYPGDSPGVLDTIGRQIAELGARDSGSFAFRYPVTKTGDLSLPEALRNLCLHCFADGIERIANALDGGSMGIGAYLDVKEEIRQTYDPGWGP